MINIYEFIKNEKQNTKKNINKKKKPAYDLKKKPLN